MQLGCAEAAQICSLHRVICVQASAAKQTMQESNGRHLLTIELRLRCALFSGHYILLLDSPIRVARHGNQDQPSTQHIMFFLHYLRGTGFWCCTDRVVVSDLAAEGNAQNGKAGHILLLLISGGVCRT